MKVLTHEEVQFIEEALEAKDKRIAELECGLMELRRYVHSTDGQRLIDNYLKGGADE